MKVVQKYMIKVSKTRFIRLCAYLHVSRAYWMCCALIIVYIKRLMKQSKHKKNIVNKMKKAYSKQYCSKQCQTALFNETSLHCIRLTPSLIAKPTFHTWNNEECQACQPSFISRRSYFKNKQLTYLCIFLYCCHDSWRINIQTCGFNR